MVDGIFLLLGQRLVGSRYAPPLAMLGIIIYAFLVGADAAVSRAAVMGLVWMLAIWVGRPGFALNSLFFSGLILTLINPLILWDVGFQLSFIATLGLIILVPPLERHIFGLLQRRLKTGQVDHGPLGWQPNRGIVRGRMVSQVCQLFAIDVNYKDLVVKIWGGTREDEPLAVGRPGNPETFGCDITDHGGIG